MANRSVNEEPQPHFGLDALRGSLSGQWLDCTAGVRKQSRSTY